MKHALCKAFCADLHVEEVPAGFAVSTGFTSVTGEALLFYAVRASADGLGWRLQDDGTTIPYIEASGADLDNGTRSEIFRQLLFEHHAIYDTDKCEIMSDIMIFDDIPHAALRFVNLLIRVQELLQTTREKAESIWVDDALNDLRTVIGSSAVLEEDAAVAPELEDWPADVVVRSPDRPPLALFFGTSDAKAYQAMLLHSTARYQLKLSCSVVLLLENDRALTAKIRQKADNSIVVPRYRGAERQAVGRIAEEALGQRPMIH